MGENADMLGYDPRKIVALREALGWKQGELAKRARLSQPSVSALERGETMKPKLETMSAIAAALGVPLTTIQVRPLPGKRGENAEEQAAAFFAALDKPSQATALLILETLLRKQGR